MNQKHRRQVIGRLTLAAILGAVLVSAWPAAPAAAGPAETAAEILEDTGVRGGLVVHLGCGDGRLTAALRAGDAYLVHGLDADPANIEKARSSLREQGLYGPVSVDTFDGKHLPYVDNLVNLLVAEDLGSVPLAEVMRVLAPGGVALVGGKKTVKPRPETIDEWPQYLHGPDNNAVAHDAVVGPPRHLQWVTDPRWSRSHMSIPTVVSMVSSGGRLFTIEDRATVENPFLPGRWSLVARDAFNGIVLWRQAFAEWEPVTRYVKDIAIQLQRRLAAIGDTVYCTPGIEAPLTALDAATGKVIKTYRETERTQEFAYDRGVLYLVIGDRMNAARYNIVKAYGGKGQNLGGSDPKAPFGGTGWRGAYARETPDIPDPVCSIVAIEAKSARVLWSIKNIHAYTACTLAIRGPYAVYQTGHGLICLNRETGNTIWSVRKPIPSGDGTEANTLVLSDNAVYAQEGNALCVYSIKDGSQKWKAPIAGNYEKSADLFLTAGAVWTGGTKQPTSYDPETGKQVHSYLQRMTGPMGHDRCYRNFITDRFYINSKTGGADFVRLKDGKEFPNHWTRGTCGMGVLPCNGLLYAPPYSCQCSIGAMVKAFNAFYTEKGLESPDQKVPVERTVRLVKGPAYGQTRNPKSEIRNDSWPTYRHDGTRGGATPSKVPADLQPLWTAQVTTVPSAPVIADGKVFVSDIHAHTLYALDAGSGQVVWEYVAGSRVDSPPTWYKGLVLFGSRDGWVHCLRASDGALAWRFKDLPDKTICAFGGLESAWPVCGSILVKDDIAYFAAGRSSFLDGGIFLYGLNPVTGEVVHRRQVYGPFDQSSGFPATGNQGFKGDIVVTDGQRLYVRHKAFKPDLTDAGSAGRHLIASAGFLDGAPQHRTYWTIASGLGRAKLPTRVRGPSGDILATDGKDSYGVRGFPVHRHSYFDPRLRGYKLFAKTVAGADVSGKAATGKKQKGRKPASRRPAAKWTANIPLTGKAMVLAGDVVFIAGTPAYFPPNHAAAEYEAGYAGERGGVLWAASAADGTKLAQYKLDAAPAWDAMAADDGHLYLCTTDGKVVCFGKKPPAPGR